MTTRIGMDYCFLDLSRQVATGTRSGNSEPIRSEIGDNAIDKIEGIYQGNLPAKPPLLEFKCSGQRYIE
jgi:hypothetical protein